MSLWISLPCTEQERGWLERLGGSWRLSDDKLWRRSEIEAALVTDEVWSFWNLPTPKGPIISFAVPNLSVVQSIVEEGALWADPPKERPWGIQAGFLRFPDSGLLVEIALVPSSEPSS